MTSITITGHATAWMNEHTSPRDLRGEPDDVVSARLHYTSRALDMSRHGWTRLGDATISVEVPDEQAIVQGKVASLRAQQQAVRAKAELINTKLETAIQNLLAIGFDAPDVVVYDNDPDPSNDIPF